MFSINKNAQYFSKLREIAYLAEYHENNWSKYKTTASKHVQIVSVEYVSVYQCMDRANTGTGFKIGCGKINNLFTCKLHRFLFPQ